MNSFRDIIAAWPSRSELATDLGVSAGVVKQWNLRDSIPAARWPAIVSAAERRGIAQVSLSVLADLAARRMEGSRDVA